jgi:NAD-dependent dihydropyrimidine dehydrogenase PreA subunit
MFWFFRGLRKGIVTTRYPEAVDGWAQTLPTPPAFHSDRLTVELVDRLVRVCPAGALAREGRTLVVDIGACTACELCVQVGPGAVERSGVFELASSRRESLVKAVPIRGEES